MSKYIEPHSLSVGYNMTGQEFFDTLIMYSEYIHSYFFSLTRQIGCQPLDTESVLKGLIESDTYNIPGNLLLNDIHDIMRWKELVEYVKDRINLSAVTVLHPHMAHMIKKEYPDLETHLSVRFWDYNDYIACSELLSENILYFIHDIDVVNISGVRSFNCNNFADDIKFYGCKTKLIVNEGCIFNRSNNYRSFPEFRTKECHGAPCKVICHDLTQKYPWMVLSRVLFYKEFIPIWKHKYDILKLSTRYISTEEIFELLQYWTSDDRTKTINSTGVRIDLNDRNWDVYMEWIKCRSECSGYCWLCKKCKKIYKDLMDGVI